MGNERTFHDFKNLANSYSSVFFHRRPQTIWNFIPRNTIDDNMRMFKPAPGTQPKTFFSDVNPLRSEGL